jgi:hypothetical protein
MHKVTTHALRLKLVVLIITEYFSSSLSSSFCTLVSMHESICISFVSLSPCLCMNELSSTSAT